MCRRRWNYSSPLRMGLEPKWSVHGMSFPLLFGTAIHTALEKYYDPILSEDLVTTFETEWFKVEQQARSQDVYDENEEEIVKHKELGVGMMKFYHDFAKRNDNLRVVCTEHEFDVRLLLVDYDSQQPVTYGGRMDAIVEDLNDGRYWIWDHKTTSTISEEYFQKLELDEQTTSYIWAANQEHAEYSGKIAGVIYNVIAKGFPKPPTILKSGKLSLDRSNEYTTAELFEQAIEDYGLEPWFAVDARAQGYLDWLKEIGDSRFVRREKVLRNRHEIASMGERIHLEARDMVNDPSIYPTPSGSWYCLRCPFRAPCIAANDGSDEEGLLRDNYTKRTVHV